MGNSDSGSQIFSHYDDDVELRGSMGKAMGDSRSRIRRIDDALDTYEKLLESIREIESKKYYESSSEFLQNFLEENKEKIESMRPFRKNLEAENKELFILLEAEKINGVDVGNVRSEWREKNVKLLTEIFDKEKMKIANFDVTFAVREILEELRIFLEEVKGIMQQKEEASKIRKMRKQMMKNE